ncbi:hypothetical protein [Phenylobacterium soli]|uniref:Uncharacterized protein n=1 Tax=Phenylobacterium soli TaxID=2170551 RepID=A0A328AEN7_9CAUL|nr:hypothetical protein [Phenylobacterium soli]RAK51844.1 hypothetical protein DJ017_18690 [Phenylobacterium soli]
MLRFVIATALIAALPAVAQAQGLHRPSALIAQARTATPAQQEQLAACMQAQAPRCGPPPCGPGATAQVDRCLVPYSACLANVKRTCTQTVMAPAPTAAPR